MRATHINVEKVENGYIVESDGKTWIAESLYDIGEICKTLSSRLDGKDDLEEFEKSVEEFVDAMKGGDNE